MKPPLRHECQSSLPGCQGRLPELVQAAVKGAFQSWSRRQTHLTSCVLLSLNVPVAVNCLVAPTAMLEFAGVTAIETKFAPVIVVVAPKH